jgi:hypothetical protein
MGFPARQPRTFSKHVGLLKKDEGQKSGMMTRKMKWKMEK